MKFFAGYLRDRAAAIVFFFAGVCLFTVTFMLYGLPVKAVLYPAALTAGAGAAACAVGYLRARRRHERLAALQTLPEDLIERLGSFKSLDDRDLTEIIRLLDESRLASKEAAERRYSDMLDYYTTWVHQIKTPIASMRLALGNEDSALSRRLTGDLLTVEQYVDMVLCYVRLDSDNTDYVIKEYSADDIVRQALRRFSPQFIGRGLRLDYSPLDFTVVTDEKWLCFVIEQVLSNALKYTPSGSVSVYAQDGDTICVRDTGMGIAASDLPRVFEKGYTGFNGRTDKRASGLGLWLCKNICDRLGAQITAQNAPDRGTLIEIRFLPQTKAAD